MGENRLRLPRLLAFLVVVALALSCDRSSSMSQPQPSAEVAGTALLLTQEGATPAVPDAVEVYVVKADAGDPKLVAALPGVPMWAWAPDDDDAALVTDITDHSATLHVISVKEGMEFASANMSGYPEAITWSPEGDWLAWKSWTQDGGTLEAMRADGSDRQQLATEPGYGTGLLSLLGWTSDGKLIVTRWAQGSDSELLQFDLSGGGKRQVATFPGDVDYAALSRDTSQVAILAANGAGCNALWIVDLSNDSPRRVLDSVCGYPTNLAWSPTGDEIAYSIQDQSEQNGVYMVDVSSRQARKISGSPREYDTVEGWLPDGSGVIAEWTGCAVFMKCIESYPQLAVIPVSGADEQTLVDQKAYSLSSAGDELAIDGDGLQLEHLPDGSSRQAMASDSDCRFGLLSWSPDGQWFSFVRSHSQGNRQFEVNADGSDLKRLDDLADAPSMPAWEEGEMPSPDGSKTAILGQPLGIKDMQSGDIVTVGGANATQVSWSADGGMLVFASCSISTPGTSDIFLVDSLGRDLRQITTGPGYKCAPVLSPDGRSVAYLRENGNPDDVRPEVQVVAVDLDTLAERVVFGVETDGGIGNDWPVWSPDGKRIAVSLGGAGIYVLDADGSGAHRAVCPGNQYLATRWLSNDQLYFVSLDDIGD